MTTTKQIDANRRNASKSTGPKSEVGKAISAQNNRRHGLLAKAVVAPSEDRGEFFDLLRDLHRQFEPVTATEEQLVERLAIAFWRDRRLAITERRAMEQEALRLPPEITDSYFPVPEKVVEMRRRERAPGYLEVASLLLFGRYQSMVTNEIKRTLIMLRDEQVLRAKTIEVEPVVQARAQNIASGTSKAEACDA